MQGGCTNEARPRGCRRRGHRTQHQKLAAGRPGSPGRRPKCAQPPPPLSTPPSTDCRADGASIVPGAVRLRAALQRGMASKVAAAMRKQAELDAKVPPCLATLEALLLRRKGLNAETAACLPPGRGRMRRRTRSGATATPPRASPNCGGWRRCARQRTLRRWDSNLVSGRTSRSQRHTVERRFECG